MQRRPRRAGLLRRQPRQQRAPQARLPALVRRQRPRTAVGGAQAVLATRPVVQPVGPVDLVLVEEVGQPARQLQPAQCIALRPQETGDRREVRLVQQVGQQRHQRPGQRLLVERAARRHRAAAEHRAPGAPQETRRQFHARGGADTQRAGQLGLEPLGHAVAGYQHDLFFQRRQRVARQPGEDGPGQRLEAVAMQHQQAGGQGFGHGRRRSRSREHAIRVARRASQPKPGTATRAGAGLVFCRSDF